jgi:hypothetical protein
MAKYFTAIIYTEKPQINGKQFLKYHNIKSDDNSLEKFFRFALKFPTAKHINFYDPQTKQFVEQVKLTR